MKRYQAVPGTVRPVRAAILLAGPLLSWSLIGVSFSNARPGELAFAAIVNALLWSPLFFSVPALLLQHERDAALPTGKSITMALWRGVRLPFALLSGPAGKEFAISLLGWSLLLSSSATEVFEGFSILLG
jgi:hypothetical protein